MEFRSDRFKIIAGLLLIIGFGMLLFSSNSDADQSILSDFNLDDCDPFEARAIVMDILPNKRQFVAAEQIIYVVDMLIGEHKLTTEMTDASGRHLDFKSFRRGQWIHVKGFKHIDGGVVALWVQKIDPPEGKKPVFRKLLNEEAPLQRTIKSGSGS